jgi:hypothetical protein
VPDGPDEADEGTVGRPAGRQLVVDHAAGEGIDLPGGDADVVEQLHVELRQLGHHDPTAAPAANRARQRIGQAPQRGGRAGSVALDGDNGWGEFSYHDCFPR